MNYIKTHPLEIRDRLEHDPYLVSRIDDKDCIGLIGGCQEISGKALDAGRLFFLTVEIVDEDDARLTGGFSDKVSPITRQPVEALDIYG